MSEPFNNVMFIYLELLQELGKRTWDYYVGNYSRKIFEDQNKRLQKSSK